MFRNVILSLIGILFLSITSFAQEWGEISDEELAMTGIAEDPEADAVVLYDIGTIKISPNFDMEFERYQRIKILTEKGKDYADFKIPYYYKDDLEDIEAVTYLPNGDEIELDDDNIFEEEIENTKKKVFAIPGVEVGAVIELRYSLYSEYLTRLEPWYFQGKEFTKNSQLTIYLPKGFSYNAFTANFERYNIKNTEQTDWDPYRPGKQIAKFVWKAQDIPAIKDEPFMNNIHDYFARLNFQLVSFRNQYVSLTYIESWDDLAKEAREFYNRLLDEDDGIEEKATELIQGCANNDEKIQKIYDYVCKTILNDSKYGWIYNKNLIDVEEVLESKKGNPVEKNLLLISLLNKAGFKARPILISTKDHGMFFPKITNLYQFNHIIVLVQLGDKQVFLDTHDKYCPLGILPVDCSVSKGFLINEENGKIISIDIPKIKSQKEIDTIAQIEEDGSIEVKSKINCEGYLARNIRKSIDKDGAKDYFKDIVDDLFENAVLDTFSVTNFDSLNKPLKLSVKFSLPGYIQETGNLAYFQTPLFTKLQDNPFKREKRYSMIDFPYTKMLNERTKIILPENYKISEIPKRTKTNMKKFSYSIFYFNSSNDKEIEINRSYRRSREQFSSREYKKLKETMDKIVESDASQIVLEKM